MVVASIGPTTSETLRECELPVDLEPEHSKMGHLVTAAAAQGQRHVPSANSDWQRPAIARRATASPRRRAPTPSQRSVGRRPVHAGLPPRAGRRTPVWLMRQAGRYMAEYREVRAKTTFLELCKNPALCAEVMLTAVERLEVDAAIIFADLLPILEPMGLDLEFAHGEGPVIHNPVREAADVDRVLELESVGRARLRDGNRAADARRSAARRFR